MSPYPCCCGGGVASCEFCNTGTTPAEVDVTFTGIVNKTCTTCNNFNTTYRLSNTALQPCVYIYTFPSAECTNYYQVTLGIASGVVSVGLTSSGFGESLTWSATGLGDPMDCAFSSLGLTLGSLPGSERCDPTGSTCTVSAV